MYKLLKIILLVMGFSSILYASQSCSSIFPNAISSIDNGSLQIDGNLINTDDRILYTKVFQGNNYDKTACDNLACIKSNTEPLSINISNSSTTNFLENGNHTFTAGTYYYNDFTLNGGGSIDITGQVVIYVKGNLNINGKINTNGNPDDLIFIYSGTNDVHINSSSKTNAYFYSSKATVYVDSYMSGSVTAHKVVVNGNGSGTVNFYSTDYIGGICGTLNTPPIVELNSTTIDENSSKTLTYLDLNSSDVESDDSILKYFITSLATNTKIFINGIEVTQLNKNTLSFTQNQINSSQITIKHDGSETLADSFEFSISDLNLTTNGVFNIKINPINDAPILESIYLSVDENTTKTITNRELNTTDAESGSSSIVYTLLSLPANGTLKLNDTNLTINSTFTQAQIDSNRLSYTHDGSESPLNDSFNFRVSDGAYPINETFYIRINPVNDAPTLDKSDIFISLNQSIAIINSTLSANDPEERPAQLVYKLTTIPTNGTLKLNNTPLIVGSTFTQDDIDNAKLSFTNNGSSAQSSFDFTLSDVVNNIAVNTISSSVKIIVNNPPVIVKHALSVNQNERKTITNSNLLSTDIEQNSSELTYSIINFPTKGNVLLNGVPLSSITQTFTQAQINSGKLEYMHSYSTDENDTFEFVVSDGFAQTYGIMNITVNKVTSTWGSLLDFYLEYTTNAYGNIKLIGNSVLCPKVGDVKTGACITNSTSRNNNIKTFYIDIDSNSATYDSTSADLVIPNDATVKFAILHWQGRHKNLASSNNSIRNTAKTSSQKVKFKTPTTSNYVDLDALDGGKCFNSDDSYECYKRVTNLVSKSGTYQVANLYTEDSSLSGNKNLYGAWALTVVYESPTDSFKNMSVYTGYIDISSDGTKSENIPINGFLTPYAGDVESNLFIFSGEGDIDLYYDVIEINDTNGNLKKVSPNSAKGNDFDSSINTNTPRNPFLINNTGIDIDSFSVGTTGSNIIGNGQTSTNIIVSTSSDQYYPGMIAFATDLYSPKVCYLETIYKNGSILDESSSVFLGDRLLFEVNISNIGTEDATKVQISKTFEAPISYNKTFGTYVSGASQTNIIGDDKVDYLDGSYRLDVRIGTGADKSNGGTIKLAQKESFLYNANIIAYPENGEINNIYTANYISDTLRILFNTVIPKCEEGGRVYPKIYVSQFKIDRDVRPKQSSGDVVLGYNQNFVYEVNLTNYAKFDEQNPRVAISFANNFMFNSVTSSDSWTCSPKNPSKITTNELICDLIGKVGRDGNQSRFTLNMTSSNSEVEFNSTVLAKSSIDTRTLGKSEPQLIKVSNVEANLSITSIDINNLGNSIEISELNKELLFEINVTNKGKDIAKDVNLSFKLTDGYTLNSWSNRWSCKQEDDNLTFSCNISELNVSSHILELNITSVGSSVKMIDLNGTMSVSSSTKDGDLSDNSAKFNIKYKKDTSLELSTKLASEFFDFNKTFDYNLTIKNTGKSTATQIEFNLSIDSLFFDENNKSGSKYNIGNSLWDCSISGSILNCKDGNLSAGSEINVTVPLITPKDKAGEFNSSVIAYAKDSNTTKEVNQTIRVGYADLSIEKITFELNGETTIDNSIIVKGLGKNLTMKIDINNSGPSTAKDINLTIPLDENFSLGTYSSGWSCKKLTNSPNVECNISTLSIGTHITLEVNLTTPKETTPNISSNATIDSTKSIDSDLTYNSKDFKINVEFTSLELSSKLASEFFDFNKTFDYNLTIKNTGKSTATQIEFNLSIDSLFFDENNKSGSKYNIGNSLWDCNISGDILNCKDGNLSAGSEINVTVPLITPKDKAGEFNSSVIAYAKDSNITPESNQTIRVGYADLSIEKITLSTVESNGQSKTGNPIDISGLERNVTIKIDINNSGPSTAKDVNITIPLDKDFSLINLNYTTGWSCSKSDDSINIICSIPSLSIGERTTLELNITTPKETTPNISSNATIDSKNIDNDSSNDSKPFTINILDVADLWVDNIKVTAIHNSISSTAVAGESLISDFGTEIIFEVELGNKGPDEAKDVNLSLNLPTTFVTANFIEVIEDSSFIPTNKCYFTSTNFICGIDNMPKIDSKLMRFRFKSPQIFNDFNVSFLINSSKTYDSNYLNNYTKDVQVKTIFSETKLMTPKNSLEIIQGGSFTLSETNNTMPDMSGKTIKSVTLYYQGYIPNADKNESFMQNSSDSNISQIVLNNQTYRDNNLSWITIPNANGGYDLVYRGEIQLDSSALNSGSNNISDLTGLADLSGWAIFVTYEDKSLDYLSAINRYDYLSIFDNNDTPNNPVDAVLDSKEFTLTFDGFYRDNNASQISTLNTTSSNSNQMAIGVGSGSANINYIDDSSIAIGSGSSDVKIKFSENDERYNSSFLAVTTRLESPLKFYAYSSNRGVKGDEKTFDIAQGDREYITLDIDRNRFDGTIYETNITYKVSSNFKYDSGIANPHVQNIGDIVNDSTENSLYYKVTLLQKLTPNQKLLSVEIDDISVKGEFTINGDRFSGIRVVKAQNDIFNYIELNRDFIFFGNFDNKFNGNGEPIGDENITTYTKGTSQEITVAPSNLALLDNNRTYQLTIKVTDNLGNVIATIPSSMLSNNGILNAEHNTTKFNMENITDFNSSVYRNLSFEVEWSLIDETNSQIVDDSGNPIKSDRASSSDPFAIRPDRFDITLPPVVRAGENFTLDIKALNSDGSSAENYNEEGDYIDESIKSSFEFGFSKILNDRGDFGYPTKITFKDGNTSDFEMNISEAGKFEANITDGYLTLGGDCKACNNLNLALLTPSKNCVDVVGCPFACVDIVSDDCSGLSRIGSDYEDINVTPYAFELTTIFDERKWLYMGGYDEKNYFEVNTTIKAINKQGNKTLNFNKNIFNDLNVSSINIDVNFSFRAENRASEDIQMVSTSGNFDVNNTDELFEKMISKNSFDFEADGEYNTTFTMNIDRNHSKPLNPVRFILNDINTTSTSNAPIVPYDLGEITDRNVTFYYGRVYSPNLEVNDSQANTEIFIEIYFKNKIYDVEDLAPSQIENSYSVYWYKNQKDSITIIDSLTTSSSYTKINNGANITDISMNNGISSTITLEAENLTTTSLKTFFIDSYSYLWFDKISNLNYDGSLKNKNNQSWFEVIFNKSISGPGVNRGINPEKINKRQIDW